MSTRRNFLLSTTAAAAPGAMFSAGMWQGGKFVALQADWAGDSMVTFTRDPDDPDETVATVAVLRPKTSPDPPISRGGYIFGVGITDVQGFERP